jgi:citrate lyase subunit beta-like protein
MQKSRRALLYVPGSDLRKIQKAVTLNVDCLCFDLEDSIAFTQKDKARKLVTQALSTFDFGNTEKLVRVNGEGTIYFENDLAAVISAHPDGIVIPKVESSAVIKKVSQLIKAAETSNGWERESICILAIVETAAGIINLGSICHSNNRLKAVIFGAEDFAANIGATRTEEGWEVFHARSEILIFCAAFGLQAIDMVNNNYRDLEPVKQEAIQGARIGFSGKQVIHPSQVEIVQSAFSPTREEVARAQKVVDLYSEQQRQGKGALGFEGRLIDMPVFRQAENILARARCSGN